jgi:hypothetical protein
MNTGLNNANIEYLMRFLPIFAFYYFNILHEEIVCNLLSAIDCLPVVSCLLQAYRNERGPVSTFCDVYLSGRAGTDVVRYPGGAQHV